MKTQTEIESKITSINNELGAIKDRQDEISLKEKNFSIVGPSVHFAEEKKILLNRQNNLKIILSTLHWILE